MVDKCTNTAKISTKMPNYSLLFTFAILILPQESLSLSEKSTEMGDLSQLGVHLFEKYDSMLSHDYDDTPVGEIIESTCQTYLRLYSKLAANFTECAVAHSRPLRFCESCVNEFAKARGVFDYLMKGSGHDSHNKPCSDVILNADRTQVVMLTHRFIKSMWDDSDCNNCYEVIHEHNGTVEAVLKNDTLHFMDLMNQTQSCFDKYTHGSILPLNVTGNHSVCRKCNQVYEELNNHYQDMAERYDKHICMDIVDTMNYTRLAWSKLFGCSQPGKHSPAVAIVAGILSFCPILFYCSNFCLGNTSQHTKLDKQKRLRSTPVPINNPAMPSCSSDEQAIG